MISCSGKDLHLFCMECPKQYIETEIGQGKCRPVCIASTDCKGTFSRAQLQQVLDQKTFDRLEHLQQQQDLAAAGLDFLSECPFCDYKQECPPVEVDKEFRCQNAKCGKTSCRLCDKETHIPLSCEEAKKDDKITLRHVVEEAMSAALIRKCNKCQQPFVKDYGCNKMSCTNCGNKQWYVHSSFKLQEEPKASSRPLETQGAVGASFSMRCTQRDILLTIMTLLFLSATWKTHISSVFALY